MSVAGLIPLLEIEYQEFSPSVAILLLFWENDLVYWI